MDLERFTFVKHKMLAKMKTGGQQNLGESDPGFKYSTTPSRRPFHIVLELEKIDCFPSTSWILSYRFRKDKRIVD